MILELYAFASSVRRHLLRILVLTVVAGGAAFLGSSLLPKTYSAEARVFVGSLTAANYDQQLAYQSLAQTYAQLASTTPVLNRVITAAHLNDRPDQLAARLDIRAPSGLSIIRIDASAPTPDEAAAIANAAAEQVIGLADDTVASTASLASVVQPATPPSSQSSPRPLLNAVVAAALALIAGATLASLVDRTEETEGGMLRTVRVKRAS
jgi:capsular polysaccharide biosynthesis protein